MKENNIGSEAIRPEKQVLLIGLDSMNPIIEMLVLFYCESTELLMFCPFCNLAFRTYHFDIFKGVDDTRLLAKCQCGKFSTLTVVSSDYVVPVGKDWGKVRDIDQVKQFTFPAEITLKIVPKLTPEEMGII